MVCQSCKELCASVRADCGCAQYRDTAAASDAYHKRKATEYESMERELARVQVALQLMTSQKDRMVVDNANLQRLLADTRYANELLKSRGGRTTALGIAIHEVRVVTASKAALEQECSLLKATVQCHEQAAWRLQHEMHARDDCMLELCAIRTQQLHQHVITMGVIDIVDGWPVRARYELPRFPFETSKSFR